MTKLNTSSNPSSRTVPRPSVERGLQRRGRSRLAPLVAFLVLLALCPGAASGAASPSQRAQRPSLADDVAFRGPVQLAGNGRRWPGRSITYSNGARRWRASVDRAARLWNLAHVGIRLRRVRGRAAQVTVLEVPTRSLGANVAGRAHLGYAPGYRARLWIGRDLRPEWALQTAIHEWGHILGLGHRRPGVCAVMVGDGNPACPGSPRPWLRTCRVLQRDDVMRAAALYGARRPRPGPAYCSRSPYFAGTYFLSDGDRRLRIETGPWMTGVAARIGSSCGSGALREYRGRSIDLPLPLGRGCVRFRGIYPGRHRSRDVTTRFNNDAQPPPPPRPPPPPPPPPRPLDEGFEAPLATRWISSPQGGWARTSEAAYSGTYSVSDSPNSPYSDLSNSTLELGRAINLTGRSQCSLVWHARYATEPGYDYAVMEMKRTSTSLWSEVGERMTGTSNGYFYPFFESLAGYEGSRDVRLRIHFVSDEYVTGQGVEFDELYVHCNT